MQSSQGPNLVVVAGQGYVGLPLALAARKAGYCVIGIDTDTERVSEIRRTYSPSPDVSSIELREAIDSGKFSVRSNYDGIEGMQIGVITVPTPLQNGKPHLGFIEAAAHQLSKLIQVGSTVILESTTYPGTTEELLCPILEAGSGLKAGKDFYVGYSPERVDPGNQEWGLLNTPKVISGINDKSLVEVQRFYESMGISIVQVSGTREAEMTKLLENTFRHVNIALINELAMFSSHLGVNIWEAIEAAGTKPFGFMKFTPGPGVGGHCLPIDPTYLSWAIKKKTNSVFRFVELANGINQQMPSFVVNRGKSLLESRGKKLAGSRVLLYGLSYKPGTSDIRESPSIAIAGELGKLGALIYALDEFVPTTRWPAGIRRDSGEETNFDLGIILTPHSQSVAASLKDRCDLVLDTKNVAADTGTFSL